LGKSNYLWKIFVKYKVLIIGLGNIGFRYDLGLSASNYIYTHARAFANHPNFELVAAVDPDFRNRNEFESNYERPTFEDIAGAASNGPFDVVIISTPTDSHLEILREVTDSLLPQIILCEKPLAYLVEEAKIMVDICERAGIILLVNYIRRSEPSVISVKEKIDHEIIKPPFKGVVYYTKGFLHNASHFFELFRYWFGAMSDFQVCRCHNHSSLDKEIDVVVNFGNEAEIHFLNLQDSDLNFWKLEIFASNGRLIYSNEEDSIIWMEKRCDKNPQGVIKEFGAPEFIKGYRSMYQLNVVNQIHNLLNKNNFNLCSGSETIETLIEMNEIVRSS
jgi:predicted dehydrogenase